MAMADFRVPRGRAPLSYGSSNSVGGSAGAGVGAADPAMAMDMDIDAYGHAMVFDPALLHHGHDFFVSQQPQPQPHAQQPQAHPQSHLHTQSHAHTHAFPPSSFDFDPFATAFDDSFYPPPGPNRPIFPSNSIPPQPHAPLSRDRYHEPQYAAATHVAPAAPADELASASQHDPDEEGEEGGAPDNKLLGFSPPVLSARVLDETGRVVDADMSAELYGMFFVAEHVFTEPSPDVAPTAQPNSPSGPVPLTCYRRNLWQISGQITLPRRVTHVVTEANQHIPVMELAASIYATESIDRKPTDIVSIPWKSSLASSSGHNQIGGGPFQVTLDLLSAGGSGGAGYEVDGGARVSVPVSWKRLQFKHATANNGRRKGMQQHYTVHMSLLARVPSGEWIRIAEVRSGAVIVRGRSPRNFDSTGEVAVTGAQGEKRGDRKQSASTSAKTTPVVKTEEADVSVLQRPPTAQQSQEHPSKRPATAHPSKPNIPVLSRPSPTRRRASPARPLVSRQQPPQRSQPPTTTAQVGVPAPLSLELSDEESTPPPSVTDKATPRSKATCETRETPESVSVSGNVAIYSSPDSDDEEPLYEYFPLSIDDWMMPVDAVYRPHFVHTGHTGESRSTQPLFGARGRIKRYFTD